MRKQKASSSAVITGTLGSPNEIANNAPRTGTEREMRREGGREGRREGEHDRAREGREGERERKGERKGEREGRERGKGDIASEQLEELKVCVFSEKTNENRISFIPCSERWQF